MSKNKEVVVTIEVKGEPVKKFKCESIVAMAAINDGHLMVGSSGMFSKNSIDAYNVIGIKALQRKLKEMESDLASVVGTVIEDDDTDNEDEADEIVVKVPKELQKKSKELLDLIEKTLVEAVKGDN